MQIIPQQSVRSANIRGTNAFLFWVTKSRLHLRKQFDSPVKVSCRNKRMTVTMTSDWMWITLATYFYVKLVTAIIPLEQNPFKTDVHVTTPGTNPLVERIFSSKSCALSTYPHRTYTFTMMASVKRLAVFAVIARLYNVSASSICFLFAHCASVMFNALMSEDSMAK